MSKNEGEIILIGVYDYTVILTYLSLLSAGTGIVVSLGGSGHPYIGTFFLLLCGLLDAFDGKVARMKKDRSPLECRFGIQIDSLSDLVAFGVLPACIGAALIRTSPMLNSWFGSPDEHWYLKLIKGLLFVVLILYMLAAMIRLAYFNVTEEERQDKEGGVRREYTGLPVTSSAIIFPAVILLRYLLSIWFEKADITLLYFPVVLITGFLFVSKIRIPKPGMRGILIWIGVGAIEFVLLLLFILNKR